LVTTTVRPDPLDVTHEGASGPFFTTSWVVAMAWVVPSKEIAMAVNPAVKVRRVPRPAGARTFNCMRQGLRAEAMSWSFIQQE